MNKYFTILNLTEDANLELVKKAYRKLVKIHHPDKNSGSAESTEKFRIIQEAYEKITEYLEKFTPKNERSENKYEDNSDSKKTKTRAENNSNKSNGKERKTEDKEKAKQKYSKTESHTSKAENKAESFQTKEEKRFTQNDSFEKELNNNQKIIKTYSIGESVVVKNFEYFVIKQTYSKIVGENIFKSESDGIYLIVEMKVTNISNVQRKIHNYMFRLSTSENNFFEFSSKGLSSIAMSGIKHIDFFGKELNPKISTTINLIFEVPEHNNYFLNLCGGDYDWAENNICICKEIETVALT